MLAPGHAMLIEKLCEARFEEQHVFKKYAHKRFLKASLFATEWAHTNAELLAASNIPTSDGMQQ
jgi:G2/mitotic-specific cyclin 2